jgi:hypothetical protein
MSPIGTSTADFSISSDAPSEPTDEGRQSSLLQISTSIGLMKLLLAVHQIGDWASLNHWRM